MMSPVFVVAVVVVALVTAAAADTDYLYYTAPGGATYGHLAGLYGAAADWRRNASALDYPDSGFQCAETEMEGLRRGLKLRSVSLDPLTNRVLANVEERVGLVTLVKAGVCRPEQPCDSNATEPELFFDQAQIEQRIGPFAYYDDTVYFVFMNDASGEQGRRRKKRSRRRRSKRRTLELRQLAGCEDKYPVNTWTSIYVNDCSRLVSTLVTVEYELVSPVWPADTLYVVRSGGESYFLVQMQRADYNEESSMAQGYTMELLVVSNSTGETVTLHEEHVAPKFLTYDIFHLGAIVLKDGRLCWSAVDTILCADWSHGSISNTHAVLKKGAAAQACLKIAADPFTAEIITGIAVATVSPETVIYFGCIAQTESFGGAGLLRAASDGATAIFSLQVNDTEILAGSMFLAPRCRRSPAENSGGKDGGKDGGSHVGDGSNSDGGTWVGELDLTSGSSRMNRNGAWWAMLASAGAVVVVVMQRELTRL